MEHLLSMFSGETEKEVGNIVSHAPDSWNTTTSCVDKWQSTDSIPSYDDASGPVNSLLEHCKDINKYHLYDRVSDESMKCDSKNVFGSLCSFETENSNYRSFEVNPVDNKTEHMRASLFDSLDMVLQERRTVEHENKYSRTYLEDSDINKLLQDEQNASSVANPIEREYSDTRTSAIGNTQTDTDNIIAQVSAGVLPYQLGQIDADHASQTENVQRQSDVMSEATTHIADTVFSTTTSVALSHSYTSTINKQRSNLDSFSSAEICNEEASTHIFTETQSSDHDSFNSAEEHKHKYEYENQQTYGASKRTISELEVVPVPAKRRKRQRDCSAASNDQYPLVLPPCRVCNARASGFHYGANTCEACKGFFRRTLAKTRVFFTCRCTGGEKGVWQTGPVRNGCPACRYERCLLVGMDKNAIKIGRYTLVRRTENIKEVKTLQTLETILHDVTQDGSDVMTRESQILQQSLELQLKEMTSLMPRHVTQSDLEPMKIQKTDFPVVPVADRLEMQEDFVIAQQEIDDLVNVLLEARRKQSCHLNKDKTACLANIKRRQDECYEQFRLKTAIFGEMKPLSKHEHLEIYKATGIDVDDRLEDIRGAVEFFEKKVRRIIHFAKAIPGFKALTLEDQATLIKCSRVESSFIGHFRKMLAHTNMELQVAAVPWGKRAYHLSELTIVYPMELILLRLTLAGELEGLGLTRGEELLMRAIAVTHTDHCHLQEPEKVRQINAKLLCYLQHLLYRRLGETEHEHVLARVFEMFTKLRQLRDLDNKVSKQLFLDYPLVSNYHMLIEFVS